METLSSFESISKEKQELLRLESEGSFVFHGTGEDVELLEPRQAIDTEKGLDREPAIFASPAADFAIFHAIVNTRNFPQGIQSESGAINHDDGSFELKFALPKESLDSLADSAAGWVYVFDKNDFKNIEGRLAEVESQTKVRPINKIRVSKQDLPSNIDSL
jgi:hypothetical protein